MYVAGTPTVVHARRGTSYYLLRVTLAVAVLAAITAFALALQPDWGLIGTSSPIVQAHLFFAVVALALGAVQLAWRKGGALHRAIGWVWVTMLGTAIISSGFIMIETPGSWSWIHATSVVHGITLALAVAFAVRRNIKWHARLMIFTYVSGLIGALVLAFIPDRLMWRAFFD